MGIIQFIKKKIAYYLKKENNLLGQKKDETLDLTRRTYRLFYVNIMDILRSFHEEAYNQMMKKYNRDLCDNIKDVDLKLLNRIISEFTTDYYYLMKPLINNNIDFDTILIAATEAKRTLTGIDKEELKNWLRKLVDDNYQLKDKKFPYVYNPNDSKEAFLTDRKAKK